MKIKHTATGAKPFPPTRNTVLRFVEDAVVRDIDFIGALALIICISPVILTIALIVAADGGPIFFAHQRIGRNGISFGCLKFRTMIVGAEDCLQEYFKYHPNAVLEWAKHQKLDFDPRVTALGRFLRRTSLDEIPQLFNVLIGHMGLVGPRPVTEAEMLTHYRYHGAFVTKVRPGITGLWQVSGRSEIDYAYRIRLDVRYVAHRSIIGDMWILLRTVPAVLARTGAH